KGDTDFLINGAGLRHADELRTVKRKRLCGRLSSANWQMWSVVVAVLALIAYVIAEAVKK
ncbi:MAG TPA: hypothetical protein VGC10_08315, partial [Sphingomonas sp.]